jgi:hypothetical protein
VVANVTLRWLAEAPPDCGSPEAINALVKTQAVRVADVLLIGPLMVYGATKMPRGPAALVLGLFGLGTILFNGVNYLRVRETHERCASGGVV